MNSFPINKYKFYTAPEGKVIAVSTYAGRTVRATAKCDAGDTFNLEKGKELAAARCNQKVARKRLARAEKEMAKAADALHAAYERVEKMRDYYVDSVDALNEANNYVEDLLELM